MQDGWRFFVDYKRAFESSTNAYMVLNRKLQYVAANAAYLRATGSTLEQLLGRYVFDAFPNEQDEAAKANQRQLLDSFTRVLKTGTADVIASIVYTVAEEGRAPYERVWSATHTPLHDASGAVEFIMQHTVDVSESPRTVSSDSGVIHQQLLNRAKSVRFTILVVDDNSPDGTAAIVKAYALNEPRVHLLLREQKEGLGAAYIAGMRHAIETLNPDIIIEMDSDGQHNPADILRLVNAITAGNDFVIGSRYIAGGSVPAAWSMHRKLISRSANLFTKTVLDTAGTHDCTGGFRAIRASVLTQIDFTALKTAGYAFQVTLLDAAVRNGARVTEIPIAFRERLRGESKMRMKDMVSGGLTLTMIRASRIFDTVFRRRTVRRAPANTTTRRHSPLRMD